ncbi:hypothetical protein [Methylobacterium sp. J-067]|uniref:hypothetical protein n=1 Tax=Methylobacterium sp. J-067 TaxID=2836648 RepID=UPI001FBB4161|nr:hypothetical protein [Methylobacterium sp. J-067]MCJ2024929.1 hypothetical protein [Methylobacterium sp. J-067]
MSEAIRVKPTHDGTYTVYRGNLALVSGLTRAQAERYEASITRMQAPVLASAG